MIIKSLLNRSITELKIAGIKTPELDAKILLEEAMKSNDAFIYSHPDFLITNAQYSKFRRYIRRRKTGEPIAYILGHKEFYGLDFKVNKNVLIPRPETEWLVERGIEYLEKQSTHNHQPLTVLDIGTGSGNISISLAYSITPNPELPTPNYFACDISSRAVAIAKKNAKQKNLTNIKFFVSDLFSNKKLPVQIDLILANLPYVPSDVSVGTPTSRRIGRDHRSHSYIDPIDFEPANAIFADGNGTSIIKRFLRESKGHLSKRGLILIELDPRNAIDIKNYAKKIFSERKIKLFKDLAGKNRYLEIEANS